MNVQMESLLIGPELLPMTVQCNCHTSRSVSRDQYTALTLVGVLSRDTDV